MSLDTPGIEELVKMSSYSTLSQKNNQHYSKMVVIFNKTLDLMVEGDIQSSVDWLIDSLQNTDIHNDLSYLDQMYSLPIYVLYSYFYYLLSQAYYRKNQTKLVLEYSENAIQIYNQHIKDDESDKLYYIRFYIYQLQGIRAKLYLDIYKFREAIPHLKEMLIIYDSVEAYDLDHSNLDMENI